MPSHSSQPPPSVQARGLPG